MGRVQFINNDGGGFAEFVELNDGETIEQFLRRQGVTEFNNYHIRYRTSPGSSPLEVAATQVLSDGNVISAVGKPGTVSSSTVVDDSARLSVTPKRVAGAVLEQLLNGDYTLGASLFRICFRCR